MKRTSRSSKKEIQWNTCQLLATCFWIAVLSFAIYAVRYWLNEVRWHPRLSVPSFVEDLTLHFLNVAPIFSLVASLAATFFIARRYVLYLLVTAIFVLVCCSFQLFAGIHLTTSRTASLPINVDNIQIHFSLSIQNYTCDDIPKMYVRRKDGLRIMDEIQNTFSCCGVTSYLNWKETLFWNQQPKAKDVFEHPAELRKHYIFRPVPRSCCCDYLNATESHCNVLFTKNFSDIDTTLIHTKGCLFKVMAFLKKNLRKAGLILLILTGLEAAVILLTMIRARHVVHEHVLLFLVTYILPTKMRKYIVPKLRRLRRSQRMSSDSKVPKHSRTQSGNPIR